ncbi:hypothetical protein FA592_11075 [Sulfurospirillum diekertiae]|jgi:hypothetical protein|uniref:Uncharacterized protein n=1 Tax=Sulfurospirillum diekertiae TaxID=1854492 RepID=A0A290HU89_9BACT|nr:hypothetical protein [Sulfurospirillum diekertiae]ATB68939.1 hypothetical protein SJPD1_0826 [Sulfurospirillum diekertiae]QIR76735.1 hypothetical protein FA584_11230 [Sulfurospirillum diekertiae]QIR79366.1 hypothetical protein FA592_11075 [Sulfurospirillum diekertiae]
MSSETSDIYEQDLQEKKALLQVCQQDKNLVTCSDCEKMFECETRKTYVKAVYESMAKGQGGGFEF